MPGVVHWGLTGGIGSGKSTVAAMLARAGAHVVDADALARSVTAAGGAAMTEIARQFGPDFVRADGALDRDRMRERVFAAPEARRQLEAIVHPLVAQASAQARAQALAQGARCVVYDVPLLVESRHWRQQVERVLVLDCAPETQLARVMARNGLARAAVLAIMAQQASRAERLACADAVLCNDGLSLAQLQAQLAALLPAMGL